MEKEHLNPVRIFAICLMWIFFLSTPTLFAQVESAWPTGKVIDTVHLKDSSGDSYSLYLPENYQPSVPTPVLFVFDPAARGSLGVNTFREAAGSRGWIVVCSNVSRNGPYEKNFEQAGSLFSDVLTRFSIDPEMIFVAGFSGGARLATTLAVLSGQIRGVIACGAAFSPNAGQMPLPGVSFAFTGILGTKDMNYQEMWKAGDWLDRIQVPHRLFFYDGLHSWPPRAHLQRAIDWMIMEVQDVGYLDTSLVLNAYETDKNIADTLYASGRFYESRWEYRQLKQQYPSLTDADDTSERLSQIEKSKDFKKEEKAFEQVRETEDRLRKQYSERFRSELDKNPLSVNIKWWSQQMQVLEKKYGESEIVAENNMYARIVNQLFAMPIEASEGFRRNEEVERSLYCNELLTVLFPDNGRFKIRMAEDLARLNRPDKMIDILEDLRASGYSNTSYIRNNRFFKPYLDRPDFPFK